MCVQPLPRDVTSIDDLLQIYRTHNVPIPDPQGQQAKYAIIWAEKMWSQTMVHI